MATTASTSQNRGPGGAPPSPTLSQLPPIPGSPTYSMASTANPFAALNLSLPPPPRPPHAILTKADLEQSQQAYADLLSGAKAYRVALAALSTAASTFGSALESCARLKEARAEALGPPDKTPPPHSTAYQLSSGAGHSGGGGGGGGGGSIFAGLSCTADPLLAAGGVQHLVANHTQILSEAVYRAFEVPLLHELDRWRAAVDDENEGYARAAQQQGREIRRLEKEGAKLHRQRWGRRDVARFREHLVDLTTKLDGLTALHGSHAGSLLREGQDVSARIVDAVCSLVRGEVDIFESLARKGWSGGGLEDLLEKGADLFAADDGGVSAHGAVGALGGAGGAGGTSAGGGGGGGPGSDGSKLFSILPPRSILADSASDSTARAGGHARADSLLVDTDRYQSLAGAAVGGGGAAEGRDSDSVFSEFNRSRGVVRPFSPPPQPVRINPDGLIIAGLEEEAAAASSAAAADSARGGAHRDDEDGGELEANEDEDMEAHRPWRDAALRKDMVGTTGSLARADTASSTSMTSSQLRERRWSVTEDDVE